MLCSSLNIREASKTTPTRKRERHLCSVALLRQRHEYCCHGMTPTFQLFYLFAGQEAALENVPEMPRGAGDIACRTTSDRRFQVRLLHLK